MNGEPTVELVSLTELLAPQPLRTVFGPWRFRRSNLTLVHPLYEIDVERCTTAAEVLDWVAQVAQKGWADAATVGWLVEALDYLLDLQGRYCAWGVERGPVDVKAAIRKLVAESLPAVDRQSVSERRSSRSSTTDRKHS